jgi:hypothetical protein
MSGMWLAACNSSSFSFEFQRSFFGKSAFISGVIIGIFVDLYAIFWRKKSFSEIGLFSFEQ